MANGVFCNSNVGDTAVFTGTVHQASCMIVHLGMTH